MTLITRTVAQDMIFNVAQHTVPSRDVLTMCGVARYYLPRTIQLFCNLVTKRPGKDSKLLNYPLTCRAAALPSGRDIDGHSNKYLRIYVSTLLSIVYVDSRQKQ